MNNGLTPYPAYRDSGVAWLGDVPAHWEVLPLKRLATLRSGAGFPVDEQGRNDLELPFLKVSDMNIPGNEKRITKWNNTVSLDTAVRLGAPIFAPGTIVFPKVGGALLTNKRRIVANECCIDNNVMGCFPHGLNKEFAFALLQNIDIGSFSRPGPVPAISEHEVGQIFAVRPPAAEQGAIVRYLDYVDARIRRYVRAKRRLIELLTEQKQALIHEAVTGRVDVRTGEPYAAYKPSGVEWLGDVPAHWEVVPNRRFMKPKKEIVNSSWSQHTLLSLTKRASSPGT